MRMFHVALLCVAGLAAVAPASAQQAKPATPPATKPGTPSAGAPSSPKDTPLPTLAMTVSQRDRDAVLEYYRAEVAAGRCPAPLVRKGKACGAPPAARPAWRIDQPLPDNVKGEAPPAGVIAKLSPSRAGYQYMRVGNDLVIMGVGTRVVAAHVADLSKM